MVLSVYEVSSHLALIVALVVTLGVVLGGISVTCGWLWLRHHQSSVGFARQRRDRIGPVGTVGGTG